MDESSEQSRVEAAQHDPSRFDVLYDDNFYRVYAYIARRVENRAAVEDLTSQVFHDALANLRQFEWRGVPFAAWLLKIAANAVRDHWLRRSRETGTPLPPDDGEDTAGHVERHAALFQLVERLPDTQRRVIEMRFVDQKSIREVAEALNKTEGAIKQLQLRAIDTLRSEWEGFR